MMSRSSAPAGSLTSATARDVLGFLRMHLDGGEARDGTRVLSEKSVRAMQQPHYLMPGTAAPAHIGLGWLLSEWDGEPVIGHGGGTFGQLSFLQSLPDRRFAVCLLTNSTTGGLLWRDLGEWLFDELAGVTMPRVPQPPRTPLELDLKAYTGRYERLSQEYEVAVDDGQLVMTATLTGPLAEKMGAAPQKLRLRPIDREQYYVKMPAGEALVVFQDFDKNGRPAYLFMGRVAPRRPGSPARRKQTGPAKTAKKAASKAAGSTRAAAKKGR
jgi:hypothetical protein